MTQRRFVRVALVVSVAIAFGLAATAYAQSDGTLAGSVHDQTGAALAGVTIAVSYRGLVAREANTDSAGTFQLSNLVPGEYDVTAVLSGFDAVRRVVRIQSGATVSLQLTLLLALREQVMVTAAKSDATIDNIGGRYPFDTPETAIPGSAYSYTDSIVHTAWTPKFGVELKLPRQALAYLSATRGFKSGGFNVSSTQPGRGFAPEWVWSYEAGVKAAPMNGRTRVNAAAFSMDYSNLQVNTPIGIGVFDIRNAAAATIRGVEVEGAARLGRGFDAGGHLTWLDATYDRYVAVAIGGTTSDVAGNRLNNAPEWAGRLWAEWKGSLAPADLLSLTIDATAQSTVFFTPFNDDVQRQRPYALVGARAQYGPAHRRWSINVYARNLTGTDYIMATFATSPAAFGGRPGAPTQFGVQTELRR